jgi:hypothetical protein
MAESIDTAIATRLVREVNELLKRYGYPIRHEYGADQIHVGWRSKCGTHTPTRKRARR